ncbi:MAG: TlpA family protein disulfide reductase [Bacteroidaceae bacterium]|nr:TlpA family protein disulfide reductase [Bacteroidaceae bacterium]
MKRILFTLAFLIGVANFELFTMHFELGVAYAQLPAITLKTMEGQTVKTDTLNNGGKPFIISFFATWCKPCNRELSAIQEVYEDWKEETGVKLIAVSTDQAQNINKVKPLVDEHGWEYEVLLDPNSDFRRALGIQMIPFTLIVDGKGKIVHKHNGYTDGAETELIEKVRELVE